MSRVIPRAAAIVAVLGLVSALTVPVAAQRSPSVRPAKDLFGEVIRTTTAYRDSVARAIPGYEAELKDADEALEERQMLHKLGRLPASYVEEAARGRAAAERGLQEARAAIEEADRIILEASVQQRLAVLPPLAPGRYESTELFVRFNGLTAWSPRNIPALEQRFRSAFGQALPVSAVGQTKVHDQLGLDHRAAVDVAVHPDSPEGQWLMQDLRRAGIPFIGVRSAVPGSSTGAHVHIGAPSARRLSSH